MSILRNEGQGLCLHGSLLSDYKKIPLPEAVVPRYFKAPEALCKAVLCRCRLAAVELHYQGYDEDVRQPTWWHSLRYGGHFLAILKFIQDIPDSTSTPHRSTPCLVSLSVVR